MKIIDAETAERWGREAVAHDPNGDDVVLAGRPPVGAADRRRRLVRAAIVTQLASLAGIGIAAATASSFALLSAAAFGGAGLVVLVFVSRAPRAPSPSPRRKAPASSVT